MSRREYASIEANSSPLFFAFRKHFSYNLQHTKTLVINDKFNPIQITFVEPLDEADQLVLSFFILLAAPKNSLYLSSLTTISTKTALFQILCLSYDIDRFHPYKHTCTIHLVNGNSSNLPI